MRLQATDIYYLTTSRGQEARYRLTESSGRVSQVEIKLSVGVQSDVRLRELQAPMLLAEYISLEL